MLFGVFHIPLHTCIVVMALFVLSLLFFSFLMGMSSEGQLEVGFYSNTCPQVDSIVGAVVRDAVLSDPNMAAVLLRLHFHDCFVQVIEVYLSLSLYILIIFIVFLYIYMGMCIR